MHPAGSKEDKSAAVADDDAAEGAAHVDQPKGGERGKKKEKSRGQNAKRNFGASKDEVGLCASRANSPEFSPSECRFGDSCKFEHDLRKYLKNWKREDLMTFRGVCPIWYVYHEPDSTFLISFSYLYAILRDLKAMFILPKLSHPVTFPWRRDTDFEIFLGKRKVNVTLDSNVVSLDHT